MARCLDSNVLCYYDEYLTIKGKAVSAERNAQGWNNHLSIPKAF